VKTDENKKKKEEEVDIKEIYTPLSVAKKEIWKRWNDKALRKKVEDFLGGDLPPHQKSDGKNFGVGGVPEVFKTSFFRLLTNVG